MPPRHKLHFVCAQWRLWRQVESLLHMLPAHSLGEIVQFGVDHMSASCAALREVQVCCMCHGCMAAWPHGRM